MFRVGGSHVADGRRRDLALRYPADLLHVELAVEQVLVDPGAALAEERLVLIGRGGISQYPRHLLGGPQSAQVIDPAERVWTIEFHIVRVVLNAFHYPVAIRVPTSWNPCERDGALDFGPMATEPFGVARELPIQVRLDDLAHLPVRSGIAEPIDAIGQHLAEAHAALVVLGESERGVAERARQAGEQELRRGLVVPDVGAVAEAAAALIVRPLKAVESAIRGAKRGLGHERGEIRHGGVE